MALEGNGNEMVMPVTPMYGNGNGMGFGGDWGWIILLLLFAGGGWGNGFGGGFGNMMLGYDFPWLLTGQNGINANTNAGFQNAMLNDEITSIRDGLNGISTQLCNGFAGIEQGANARQIANMQQMFGLQSQFADCCCENRLGIANLNSTIISENCADRQALNEGVRDILANQTASVQRILDQMCQDKIDEKNDQIAQLRQELLYSRGQASQVAQTSAIVDQTYNRLATCPVGTVPVYGEQPIFRCNNNGCGCGGNTFLN